MSETVTVTVSLDDAKFIVDKLRYSEWTGTTDWEKTYSTIKRLEAAIEEAERGEENETR